MYKKKRILALIPARGGSKGLPGKNIRSLNGKPLIAWTIEEAKKSRYLDTIIVSTDDKKIAAISETYGAKVPFIRPKYLATDNAAGINVVLHCLKQFKNVIESFPVLVLLQPTSPLRKTEDIDKAIEFFFSKSADSLTSITDFEHSPFGMLKLYRGFITPVYKKWMLAQRQNQPVVYRENGAIYICNTAFILKKKSFYSKKTVGFYMPPEKSIDIDTEIDLKIAGAFLKKNYYGY